MYVYTFFVSDFILTKFVGAGKTSRQTLLFDHWLYTGRILHGGHIAINTKPSPDYIPLTEFTISGS